MALRRITAVNSGYNASESVFYNPSFQYPTAVSKYLQLLVVPVDLTLYHTMYIIPVWLNWMIFILYLSGLVYFFFKNKRVFFALAFIFMVTAPSMMPVKVSWLVAERYIFFGSLGFCLLLGIILENIWRKQKLVAVGFLGILVAGGATRVVLRNIDWQTNHKLWVNTCQVSPNSHNAWNNIGDDYDKLKQYDNAIKGFSQSTVIKPNYADAYHNRANIFFKIGRLDLARDSYNTTLYYSSTLYQTYISLTQIDLIEKKFDLALTHAQKAVELQPGNPQAFYVLGVVNAQMGNKQEARKIFESILNDFPNFQMARQALFELGR
jgi:tetratricopeptide (TPR) repeat protein